jgi:regulator of protease activity HflC (stomatin/prohibitin superfamily)
LGYIVVLFVVIVFLLVWAVTGIRIIRPYQRGVVERLGRFKATVNPGLRIIFPIVETVRTVDMREQVVDVPPQEVITADNVVVSVDAVIYYEPTDPQRLIYNVANFLLAVTKLAQTNLRNVIGDMQLDEALTSRDKLNLALRQILDDATDKWGVRVVRVEIQRIDPPPDVMHAMHEQMKAERTRRAVVLTADGERTANITRAEGEQKSVILRAEGDKQEKILRAEGEAQAIEKVAAAESYRQRTVAEGEAQAILSVFNAIHDGQPDTQLLTLKYLDTLRAMADGQATKIIVPTELAGLAGSLTAVSELLSSNGGGGHSNGQSNGSGSDDTVVALPPVPPAPPA